jgi:hypothetical protein
VPEIIGGETTDEGIGDEQDPLEVVPLETRLAGGALLAEPAGLDAIVVLVLGVGHAGRTGGEGLAAAAALGHGRVVARLCATLADVAERRELGGEVVLRERRAGAARRPEQRHVAAAALVRGQRRVRRLVRERGRLARRRIHQVPGRRVCLLGADGRLARVAAKGDGVGGQTETSKRQAAA